MKKRFLGGCCFLLFLGACAHNAPVPAEQLSSTHLLKKQMVYIARVPGSIEEANIPVQKAFVAALTPYTSQLVEGNRPIPSEYLPKIAGAMKTGYIFYPKVTQWEDHNTPWTTLRDKVTIEVLVMDVQSERVVVRRTLSGVSKLWVSRNEKPDVVARDLIVNFINELFE